MNKKYINDELNFSLVKKPFILQYVQWKYTNNELSN